MKRDAIEAAKPKTLRHDIDVAWQQADNGDFVNFDPHRISRELGILENPADKNA